MIDLNFRNPGIESKCVSALRSLPQDSSSELLLGYATGSWFQTGSIHVP